MRTFECVIPEQDFYNRLGQRIRELRKGAELNQERLARDLTVSRTSVTNIEQGRQRPSIYLLVQIAHALGVHLQELLPNTDQDPSKTALPKNAEALQSDEQDWVRKIAAHMTSKDDE